MRGDQSLGQGRRAGTRSVAGPTLQAILDQGGKLPPHDRNAEEAVLGSLMLEKDALNEVVDILKVDHFYHEEHRAIYSAILSLFAKSSAIDLITVNEQLLREATAELAGGQAYLARLTSRVMSAANIEYHARIVQEKYIKRRLIEISGSINREAFDPTTDVFEVMDKSESELYAVRDENIRRNYTDIRDTLRQAMDELAARRDHKDELTGIPTGLMALDRITSGWQKSDLVIIAARPGMGKTAFVLSCARNAAVHFRKPVAIFSLEMASVQLVNRLISSEAEIDSERLKRGDLTEHDWRNLTTKVEGLASAPLFIDDTPALSILELRAKCRRLRSQHGVELIIIDYLQLMTGDQGKGNQGNREQEIASISRALKNLAKELNVPVLALSQLSRASEKRDVKKPQLSDLRESGSIEQDADMVLFLYRPEYYGITVGESGENLEGVGEVIIAKHRNGSLANVNLRFIGRFTKFTNLEDTSTYLPPLPGDPGRIPSDFDMPSAGATLTLGSKVNRPLSPPPPPPDLDDVPF